MCFCVLEIIVNNQSKQDLYFFLKNVVHKLALFSLQLHLIWPSFKNIFSSPWIPFIFICLCFVFAGQSVSTSFWVPKAPESWSKYTTTVNSVPSRFPRRCYSFFVYLKIKMSTKISFFFFFFFLCGAPIAGTLFSGHLANAFIHLINICLQ